MKAAILISKVVHELLDFAERAIVYGRRRFGVWDNAAPLIGDRAVWFGCVEFRCHRHRFNRFDGCNGFDDQSRRLALACGGEAQGRNAGDPSRGGDWLG